jgi:hypothetical protein
MIASLFDDQPRRTIQDRFEQFHEAHPEVYLEIVRMARELKAAGHQRYSMDALLHVIRWHRHVRREHGGEFKINDHMSSRYSRLVQMMEPDLDGFFETRGLKAV